MEAAHWSAACLLSAGSRKWLRDSSEASSGRSANSTSRILAASQRRLIWHRDPNIHPLSCFHPALQCLLRLKRSMIQVGGLHTAAAATGRIAYLTHRYERNKGIACLEFLHEAPMFASQVSISRFDNGGFVGSYTTVTSTRTDSWSWTSKPAATLTSAFTQTLSLTTRSLAKA